MGEKKIPYCDPLTGEIDLKYDVLDISKDFFIGSYPDETKSAKADESKTNEFLEKINQILNKGNNGE